MLMSAVPPSIIVFGVLTISAGAVQAHCMKDGAEVKVGGKDLKEKQADCEKQGGTWEKTKKKEEKAKDEAAGSGGGW